MKKVKITWQEGLILLAAIGCSLLIAFHGQLIEHYTRTKLTTTVVRREQRLDVSVDRFLIHTPGETFEITGSLWEGSEKAWQLYGSITVGKSYQFVVRGLRSHSFGWRRQILDVKKLSNHVQFSPP